MPDRIGVAVKRLPHGEGLDLPYYATSGAAGMDVVSAENVTLAPGARHAVATGIALAILPGYEIQVRPRSGLPLMHAIKVTTTPDTSAPDAPVSLKVILLNTVSAPFLTDPGYPL